MTLLTDDKQRFVRKLRVARHCPGSTLEVLPLVVRGGSADHHLSHGFQGAGGCTLVLITADRAHPGGTSKQLMVSET